MERERMKKNILQFALDYQKRGFSIIPIRQKDKKPLIPWKKYQTQRATEQEIIEWLEEWPDANIGIVTGAVSGLTVVDLDSEDAFKFVETKGGIDTPFVKTGKGFHAYCKYKDGVRNFQKKANLPDIDLRGEGGYVVAPPSIHESGFIYQWERGKGLDDLSFAPLPSWILAEDSNEKQPLTELFDGVEEGSRNNALARLVGSWLNDGLSYGACLENADIWNSKNNPPLSYSEVEGTVHSIMMTHMRSNSSPTKIDWPEPTSLPEGLLPVQKLDEVMIPEPLRGWVADMAERMQVSPDFMTAAAIVAVASVIGRGCGIYPKRKDDWLVVPNLWGAVVSPPSFLKTPAINAALAPLDRLIYDANEEYRQKMSDCEFELAVVAAKKDSLKTELKKALKTNDKAQIERLRGEDTEVARPPHRRFATQDGTTEKIGEILVDNPRGILVKRDELIAFLKSLDKQGREGDRGFYLESWNGTGRFTVDRIGRGTLDVPALCISIFGAIIPGPLHEYVHASLRQGAGDDGFMQRFQLLVYPDPPKTWKSVDRFPDTKEKKRAYGIFKKLASDECFKDAEFTEFQKEIPALRFSYEAQEVFNEWREKLEMRLLKDDTLSSTMLSHLAKYRSLMPSLSLIFHLIDVADGKAFGDISEEATVLAAAWCDYLETHANRVYGAKNAFEIESAREILKRIKRSDLQDGCSPRDIYRNQWHRLTNSEEVNAGLEVLESFGWARSEFKQTEGRTGRVIRFHPAIFSK